MSPHNYYMQAAGGMVEWHMWLKEPWRLSRDVIDGRGQLATTRTRRKRGNRLEVSCVYRFEAKCWLIKKLEVLLQPRHRLPNSCPF